MDCSTNEHASRRHPKIRVVREAASSAQDICGRGAASAQQDTQDQIANDFRSERRQAKPILYGLAHLARCEEAQAALLIPAALALWVVGFWYAAARDSASTTRITFSDASNNSVLVPPPLIFRRVEPDQAFEINESIPLSRSPNPPAEKFRFRGEKDAFDSAIECLTSAIYYEAGSESLDGQRAVAQVVLNRVRHAAFPKSICDVVYQGSKRPSGCQFTFTCDGALARKPDAEGWARARQVADEALKGMVFGSVGYATHYHANYVVPSWATSLSKNALLGRHVFYRWPGWWGTPAAFKRNYSGTEGDPHILREAALRAHGYDVNVAHAANGDISLATDPRVELISVVQLLASRSVPSAAETEYQAAVRQHFSRYSNHLAVLIFRQYPGSPRGSALNLWAQILMNLSLPPHLEPRQKLEPQLVKAAGGRVKIAGFVAALRDFSKQTHFEAFYAARQPYYAKLSRVWSANLIVTDTRRFRGGRIIVAPLLQTSMVLACPTTTQYGDPGIVVALAAAPEAPQALARKQMESWLTCSDRRSASAAHDRPL